MKLRLHILFLTGILFACACNKNESTSTGLEDGRRPYFSNGYMINRRVEYAVDNFLNLETTKHVRIELHPEVLDVPINTEQDGSCEREPGQACGRPRLRPLRSGIYLLRYALFRTQHESEPGSRQIISSGEQLVEVASGKMIADIALKIKDLRVINSRNSLAIELSSVREEKVKRQGNSFVQPDDLSTLEFFNSGLLRQAYEAPIEPNGSTRLTFAPVDFDSLFESSKRTHTALKNMKDVIAAAKILDQQEVQANAQLKAHFKQTQNLIEWPMNQAELGNISREQLLRGEIDRQLYYSLCSLWQSKILPEVVSEFSEARPRSYSAEFNWTCQNSRHKGLKNYAWIRRLGYTYQPFFIFQKVIQVEKAHIREQRPPGRNFALQIGEEFYVRSRTEYNYEAGLRPLSWIPLVGPYLSLAGVMAIDVSLKQDSGNELRFATSMQVNVEENTLSLELQKYRRCLIVRMNPTHIDSLTVIRFTHQVQDVVKRDQLRRALSERGLMICDREETQPLIRNEKYYFLSTARETGAQQDPADLRNKQVALPLRSERDFLTFMEAGKSRLQFPDSTGSQFSGSVTWVGEVERSFLSLPSASPGLYIDSVFY